METVSKKIEKIFLEDQDDRKKKEWIKLGDKKRWSFILPRDKERRKKINSLLRKKGVLSGKDYFHAGIIFQHGISKISIKRAQELAKLGMRNGHKKAAWLYAASTDRLLVMENKPQKFGTQFRKNKNGIWELFPIQYKTTDKERKKYGVRSLQGLKRVVSQLNDSGTALRKKTGVSSR